MRAEADWSRILLIALALVVAAGTLVVPLALIFVSAFADGLAAYARNITAPDMLHAIFLTVLTAVIEKLGELEVHALELASTLTALKNLP